MIDLNSKISTIVSTQLPSFINNDTDTYSNFIEFIKAYYLWLEQPDNLLYNSKNILNYKDIDTTTDQFIEYYLNEFFQYFPKATDGTSIDNNRALRIAKELYSSKGTVSSFKFLFKILYNINCDISFTKDYVLKPSSGTWFVPKNLTIKSSNLQFLNINNYRILGNISKSFGTVENSVQNGDYIEIYLSNIVRKFQSGETLIVVDDQNNPVKFNGQQLTTKLIGHVDSITIDPNNTGRNYLAGYPVTIYKGIDSKLKANSAVAIINSTTLGEILTADVINGGYGYSFSGTKITANNSDNAVVIVDNVVSTLPPAINIINGGINYSINDIVYIGDSTNPSTYYPFADITNVDSNGSILEITYRRNINSTKIYGLSPSVLSSSPLASGANLLISTVNRNANALSTLLVKDSINVFFTTCVNTPIANSYYNFAKAPFANWYTKLSDAFTFDQIQTYSLDSLAIANPGINSTGIPTTLTASSLYFTDDINVVSTGDIQQYGTLAPVVILNSGTGYNINDTVSFTGGSGIGASAIVTKVNSSGAILNIDYVYKTVTTIQQKRNLLLNTENFSNTVSWIASNSTITPNITTVVSPFNTLNVSKISANNTLSKHYIRQNVKITANNICSLSFYAKAAEFSYVALSLYNTISTSGTGTVINLLDGSISSTLTYGNNNTPYIQTYVSENAGNGWWKIKLTVLLSPLSSNTYFEIGPCSTSTNYSSYQGDNSSGVYIYGTQLEQNPIITDYQQITDSSANDFIHTSNTGYPLGGMNYTNLSLPSVSVNSSNVNATGAILSVTNILGTGAKFYSNNATYGEIQSISVINGGEDYSSLPKISLKIQDVLVKNVDVTTLPDKLDIIKQLDESNNTVYRALFDSLYLVKNNIIPEEIYYGMRLFEYSGNFDPNLELVDITNGSTFTVIQNGYAANTITGTPDFDIQGLKTYGDGNAKATCTFIDGLNIGKGQYIDSKGQLSSFNVLQNEDYNDYTYKIYVEKELIKYKDILLNLLHPAGTKMLSSCIIKPDTQYYTSSSDTIYKEYSTVPLIEYAGANTSISLSVDFLGTANTKSTNVLKFNNLSSSLLFSLFNNDTIIEINTATGIQYKTQINLVDNINNIVYLKENVWLTFCNVCSISTANNSNIVNVNYLTSSYKTINSGFYSNSANPLFNLISAGDSVYIANNGSNSINTVVNIDYDKNIIYLSNNLIQDSKTALLTVNRNIIEQSNVNIISSDINPTLADLFIALNNTINPSKGTYTYLKSNTSNSTYFSSTGYLTTSINAPRFGYHPTKGTYLGYLSENSGNNLFTNSETFGISILDQADGNGWVTMVGN